MERYKAAKERKKGREAALSSFSILGFGDEHDDKVDNTSISIQYTARLKREATSSNRRQRINIIATHTEEEGKKRDGS